MQGMKPGDIVFSQSPMVAHYSAVLSRNDIEEFFKHVRKENFANLSSKGTDNPAAPCSLLRAFRLASHLNEFWGQVLTGTLRVTQRPMLEKFSDEIRNGSVPRDDQPKAAEITAYLFASEILQANEVSETLISQATQQECMNEIFRPGLIRMRLAAVQGDLDAQRKLGIIYAIGEGVTQDYQEAAKWSRLAAAQGDAVAQYNLGWMYNQGKGVKQDHREAMKLYRLAAAKGDAGAQLNLGTMYYRGEGVTQDYQEAVKWFRLAAAQGDVNAQYNLGSMYDGGKGVTQDHREAVKWYRLAAVQGDADAQFNLGISYAIGEGVTQDYVRSHMWLTLAAAGGNSNAAKERDLVASKMTAQQTTAALKLTRECENINYKNCD